MESDYDTGWRDGYAEREPQINTVSTQLDRCLSQRQLDQRAKELEVQRAYTTGYNAALQKLQSYLDAVEGGGWTFNDNDVRAFLKNQDVKP